MTTTTPNNTTKDIPDNTLVILLHGLHQNPWIMRPLAKRLQAQGFPTHQQGYASLKDRIERHSTRLHHWLEQHHDPDTPFHMVGHSLGGLVIRDFIARYPKWQVARCVTLGTPHNGSITADYFKRIAPLFVGRSYQGALDGSTAALADGVSLGVIAGNSPHGLGQVFLQHHQRKHHKHSLSGQHAHDGTVYVSETQLANASDHITLPVSHTGMLVNQAVANQTAYFLRHGHFKR